MIFLRCQVVGVLRRCCCCPLAATVARFRSASLPTSGLTSSFSNVTVSRALSTSWTLRKDAPQPEDADARRQLDLDVWKSVMRSQALLEEKPKDGEDKESTTELEEELTPLEASRRLVETWRLAGKLVPENLTDEQLETLAELSSKSSKRKYLKYLAVKEGHKKANKEKKEKKKAVRMAEKEEAKQADREHEDGEEEGEPKLKNTFLMQFWSRSLDKLLGWRAAQAMQFGQPLVFDMSYDQHMSRQEMENTVSQLLETEGWNRRAVDPFHLHFCNLQPNNAYHRELFKRYSQETWERLLITATSQRHIDVFPHKSLVYLTADSPNVLHTFDHSKVYVVGAMVDRSIQSGVSLANAKRLNMATARLPLDEYLHWDSGAKNLTLDQMIRILLTVKDTNNWEKALKFVPKRKHTGFHQQRRENSVQSRAPVRTAYRDPEAESVQLFVSKQRQRKAIPKKPSFGSEHNSGQPRIRTALKSKMGECSKVTSKRNWWDEE